MFVPALTIFESDTKIVFCPDNHPELGEDANRDAISIESGDDGQDPIVQEVDVRHLSGDRWKRTLKRAYNVLGIIKLVRGYYVVYAAEVTLIGPLGPNSVRVFRIDRVALEPVHRARAARGAERKQERRLVKEIERHMSNGSFYFSPDADITRSLRAQALDKDENQFNRDFMWNYDIAQLFLRKPVLRQYVLPVICGYFGVEHFDIPAGDPTKSPKRITIALISRRGTGRVGVRFHSRGINSHGHVSNYVETEQVLVFGEYTCSYTIVRGSIPIYWEQPHSSNVQYYPKIQVNRNIARNLPAMQLHMEGIYKSYGGRITMVSLVDQEGPRESDLSASFGLHAYLLRAVMGEKADETFKYVAFDYHTHCKRPNYDEGIEKLLEDLWPELCRQGFSCFGPAGQTMSLQSGSFRVNCVDCLDRTNVVQSEIALLALVRQLGHLKLFHRKDMDKKASYLRSFMHAHLRRFLESFKHLWADNGDAISRQYSGTGALKADVTRKGKRTMAGMMHDGVKALRRYYLHHRKDNMRQDALDVLLGHARSAPDFAQLVGVAGPLKRIDRDADIVLYEVRHISPGGGSFASTAEIDVSNGLIRIVSSSGLSREFPASSIEQIERLQGNPRAVRLFFSGARLPVFSLVFPTAMLAADFGNLALTLLVHGGATARKSVLHESRSSLSGDVLEALAAAVLMDSPRIDADPAVGSVRDEAESGTSSDADEDGGERGDVDARKTPTDAHEHGGCEHGVRPGDAAESTPGTDRVLPVGTDRPGDHDAPRRATTAKVRFSPSVDRGDIAPTRSTRAGSAESDGERERSTDEREESATRSVERTAEPVERAAVSAECTSVSAERAAVSAESAAVSVESVYPGASGAAAGVEAQRRAREARARLFGRTTSPLERLYRDGRVLGAIPCSLWVGDDPADILQLRDSDGSAASAQGLAVFVLSVTERTNPMGINAACPITAPVREIMDELGASSLARAFLALIAQRGTPVVAVAGLFDTHVIVVCADAELVPAIGDVRVAATPLRNTRYGVAAIALRVFDTRVCFAASSLRSLMQHHSQINGKRVVDLCEGVLAALSMNLGVVDATLAYAHTAWIESRREISTEHDERVSSGFAAARESSASQQRVATLLFRSYPGVSAAENPSTRDYPLSCGGSMATRDDAEAREIDDDHVYKLRLPLIHLIAPTLEGRSGLWKLTFSEIQCHHMALRPSDSRARYLPFVSFAGDFVNERVRTSLNNERYHAAWEDEIVIQTCFSTLHALSRASLSVSVFEASDISVDQAQIIGLSPVDLTDLSAAGNGSTAAIQCSTVLSLRSIPRGTISFTITAELVPFSSDHHPLLGVESKEETEPPKKEKLLASTRLKGKEIGMRFRRSLRIGKARLEGLRYVTVKLTDRTEKLTAVTDTGANAEGAAGFDSVGGEVLESADDSDARPLTYVECLANDNAILPDLPEDSDTYESNPARSSSQWYDMSDMSESDSSDKEG